MFTGIVAAVGRIQEILPLADGQADAGVHLNIHAGGLDLSDVGLGDSIAIQGACMTVVAKSEQGFAVDVSRESLRLTMGLDALGEVNLEKSLRVGDQIGGHIVSGHVDGLGTVIKFEPVGESWELIIEAPATLAPFLAYKGSITVNGVSLTVNRVNDQSSNPATTQFSINLIPHTIAVTTLKHLKAGQRVNLEVDTIARYVQRMLSYPSK
jgi:riboflavin synthase